MNTSSRYLKWRSRKFYKRMVWALCSKLYKDVHSDIGRSILVAGAGRSGTTWLADIIASQIPCRVMFEPFHSKKVEAFRQFNYFQYMQADDQHEALWSYCRNIFTGDIRDGWIDRQVGLIFPKYRLIKEIRANLFLAWIHAKFPEIPILFIIRHPCAVVSSRMQLDWWTDQDIAPILSQPKLINDFLLEKMEVIRRAKTAEEKHAVVWCINNLVPLQQFNSQGFTTTFYENLCLEPEVEVAKIFNAIGQDYSRSVFDSMTKPSTTSLHSSAIVTGEDKVGQWKNKLSLQQINKILAIVRDFEIDYIYGDSVAPLVESF